LLSILYLHNVPFGNLKNLQYPRIFGFASGQARYFKIPVICAESGGKSHDLFAWHISSSYREFKDGRIVNSSTEKDNIGDDDESLRDEVKKLLDKDDGKRVVIYFHGNAGNVASGWRPDVYRNLAAANNNAHIIGFDYRSFGDSSGNSPDEDGLIEDGVSVIKYMMHDLNVDPRRIFLVGQSLGTAVVAAVLKEFATKVHKYSTNTSHRTRTSTGISMADQRNEITIDKTLFGGAMLIAPFYNIPSLLLTYKAGGFVPIMKPLAKASRSLTKRFLAWAVVDTWNTGSRLEIYVAAACKILSEQKQSSNIGNLYILHAYDDSEVPWNQTEQIYNLLFATHRQSCEPKKDVVDFLHSEVLLGGINIDVELVQYGLHNRICTYSVVRTALERLLNLANRDRVMADT